MKSMELNDELHDSAEHFSRHYVLACIGAHCNREGLGLNTNMHLESLREVLKHICTRGKRAQRVNSVVGELRLVTKSPLA